MRLEGGEGCPAVEGWSRIVSPWDCIFSTVGDAESRYAAALLPATVGCVCRGARSDPTGVTGGGGC